MAKTLIAALLAGFAALAPMAAQAQEANPATTVIHAGRLLADPDAGAVAVEQSIFIGEDGRILAVTPGYQPAPEGAALIDLSDAFVLPGLIDSHVHLLMDRAPGENVRLTGLTRSNALAAFHGGANARATLRAGFTTVADLGSNPEAIFALRDAINGGLTQGPRIIAAGLAITPHGGHADINGYRQDLMDAFGSPGACSGPDDCRRAVRRMIQAGADVIKITATGGVLSNTAAGVGQQFSQAELEAIVDAAHAMGRRVVAHAHGVDGVNAALRAGVDGIEHGTYLDAESIRLFRRTGAVLTPTVLAGRTVVELAAIPNALTPAQREKALEVGPLMLDMLRRAHEGRVTIAFGTDSGVSRHGENAREFALMVEAGFTPLEAIAAATTVGARHLRLEREIGRIAPGFVADLIAVDEDPLADVNALLDVDFVMARGRVVALSDR